MCVEVVHCVLCVLLVVDLPSSASMQTESMTADMVSLSLSCLDYLYIVLNLLCFRMNLVLKIIPSCWIYV